MHKVHKAKHCVLQSCGTRQRPHALGHDCVAALPSWPFVDAGAVGDCDGAGAGAEAGAGAAAGAAVAAAATAGAGAAAFVLALRPDTLVSMDAMRLFNAFKARCRRRSATGSTTFGAAAASTSVWCCTPVGRGGGGTAGSLKNHRPPSTEYTTRLSASTGGRIASGNMAANANSSRQSPRDSPRGCQNRRNAHESTRATLAMAVSSPMPSTSSRTRVTARTSTGKCWHMSCEAQPAARHPTQRSGAYPVLHRFGVGYRAFGVQLKGSDSQGLDNPRCAIDVIEAGRWAMRSVREASRNHITRDNTATRCKPRTGGRFRTSQSTRTLSPEQLQAPSAPS